MISKVIGLGAGGHCKVVIEILRLMPELNVIGLLDPCKELWGRKVMDIPVLGDDSLLPELYDKGVRQAFIGLGVITDTRPRQRLYQMARDAGFQIASAVHPHSTISISVRLGAGVTIMAGTVINACTTLGDNVIVNTGAVIEHDCLIADHVHIAPGAILAGNVCVGEGANVGMGACIRQGLKIGRHAVVGAGAMVVRDVPDDVVVAGVPARIMKDA